MTWRSEIVSLPEFDQNCFIFIPFVLNHKHNFFSAHVGGKTCLRHVTSIMNWNVYRLWIILFFCGIFCTNKIAKQQSASSIILTNFRRVITSSRVELFKDGFKRGFLMITSHNFMIQMLGREAKVKVFNFLLFDFWGLNVSTEEDFQPLIQITCKSTFNSAFLLKIKTFFSFVICR